MGDLLELQDVSVYSALALEEVQYYLYLNISI
jgi:hypothetical protein